MRLVPAAALLCTLALGACVVRRGPPSPAGYPETTSLLGQPLYAPELPLERRQQLEAEWRQAYDGYARDTDDADAIIWLGRRTAYLGRYRDAVGVFTEGIHKHPRDARMYRHRGHRWITLREFGNAVRDLEHAALLMRARPDEVEPDGQPNARGVPLTTLHGNVWYHLGLAYYLRGEWARALAAFRNSLIVARNDDSRVASSDWIYMTLRRMGRHDEAARVLEPIRPDMEIVENNAYHRRLLMYKGLLPPDSLLAPGGQDAVTLATQGYGVGNWLLVNGKREEAEEIFWRVTTAENWAPFGYIAAEADLRRIGRARR
ncbi:MAG TPA: tetratricopeptide repeat protein [Longimicrobium sp.]|nr:tetratricopeptide repeat protein [Longimicrobium sp.]